MFRRLALVAAVALIPVGVPASALSFAASPHEDLSPSLYPGDWTADTTSGTGLAGESFELGTTDTSPRNFVTDPETQAQFDNYCNPVQAGNPVTFFILSHSWSPDGEMGGCISPRTGGHVYVWGANRDTAYVHPGTVNGERVLQGAYGVLGSNDEYTYRKLTAHRADAQFVVHGKRDQVVNKSAHVYQETEVNGIGDVRLEYWLKNDCHSSDAEQGDGSLSVDITRVGGPEVVDFYNLTVELADPTAGNSAICEGHPDLNGIPVRVTKSDPTEKDPCKVGAVGTLVLADRDTAQPGDTAHIEVPACNLNVTVQQPRHPTKNNHVAVAINVNQNGY